MEHAGLIRQLFEVCDVDGDGRLRSRDLRRFAELTGFEGGDAEWPEAFKALCASRSINPALGLSIGDWAALVDDDDEENACFCSDGDLRRILKVLSAEAEDDGVTVMELVVNSGIEHIGLNLDSRQGKLVAIKTVDEGSWADVSGVLAGDILESVNDTIVQDMTCEDVKALLKGRPLKLQLCRAERLQDTKSFSGGDDVHREDRLTHCREHHELKWRMLGKLEGRINPSLCAICRREIPRKQERYSCKPCHYSVCVDCYPSSGSTRSGDRRPSGRYPQAAGG